MTEDITGGAEEVDFTDPETLNRLFGAAAVPAEEPEPINVRRYWLDEASFRALAVLEQDGQAALIVNDGEHQVVLFDSVSQDINGLYTLMDAIDTAIGILTVPEEDNDE